MQLFPDPKILLSIGDVHITWYAVLILTGALIAYALSLRTLKKWGYDSEILENFFVFFLPFSLLTYSHAGENKYEINPYKRLCHTTFL